MSLYVPIIDLKPERIPNVGALETEIFRQIGVRFVIRARAITDIADTRKACRELNTYLDLRADGLKVSQIRHALAHAIGLTYIDVVVISSQGLVANGNCLVENIRWHKDEK
jgi:hypothetical protein